MATEQVFDKTYPGGLHLVQARVVDANGVDLAAPPGTAPLDAPKGVSDAAKAAASAAESDRVAQWATMQAERDQAAFGDAIAQALETPVAGLDAYLADCSDPAAIEAMAAADVRVTAAAHYAARLAELVPPEAPSASPADAA